MEYKARDYIIYGGESYHFNASPPFEFCLGLGVDLDLRAMLAGQRFVHQSLPFFASQLSKVGFLQFRQ